MISDMNKIHWHLERGLKKLEQTLPPVLIILAKPFLTTVIAWMRTVLRLNMGVLSLNNTLSRVISPFLPSQIYYTKQK